MPQFQTNATGIFIIDSSILTVERTAIKICIMKPDFFTYVYIIYIYSFYINGKHLTMNDHDEPKPVDYVAVFTDIR